MTVTTITRTCRDCHQPVTTGRSNRGVCGRCYRRRDRAGTLHELPTLRRSSTQTLAAYDDLTSTGCTRQQVADHLGLTVDGLLVALKRARKTTRNKQTKEEAPMGVRTPAGPRGVKAGVCPAYGDPLAACRRENPELFFVPDDERGVAKVRRIRKAKQVCAGCPLARVCAQWAVRTRQEYGVFGGLSEDDRRKIWQRLDTAVPV